MIEGAYALFFYVVKYTSKNRINKHYGYKCFRANIKLRRITMAGLRQTIKDKATNMYTSALKKVDDVSDRYMDTYARSGGIGTGMRMGGDAINAMKQNVLATAGTVGGAAYGMASDDTSVIGGAMMGGIAGKAGSMGYHKGKSAYAGYKSRK
jgi:hypothetical protein